MSVAESLLALAVEEMTRQGCGRLERIRVQYGAISGVMPESLEFCFSVLVAETPHARARLELVCLPLRLRCALCGQEFGGEGQEALYLPCPACGEQFGHVVLQGKELILQQIEAV